MNCGETTALSEGLKVLVPKAEVSELTRMHVLLFTAHKPLTIRPHQPAAAQNKNTLFTVAPKSTTAVACFHKGLR